MASPEDEAEIQELAVKYGEPRRITREYHMETDEHREWMKDLATRRGEVILLVPRPDGRVLVHTKSFYPSAVFRLPSGGIKRGERVEAAARRETYEEMGFSPDLVRLVGVVENEFVDGETRVSYPSFIFQTQPVAEPPRIMDPGERITEFKEATVEDLRDVERILNSLPSDWETWGNFRAAPHALAAEWLEENYGGLSGQR